MPVKAVAGAMHQRVNQIGMSLQRQTMLLPTPSTPPSRRATSAKDDEALQKLPDIELRQGYIMARLVTEYRLSVPAAAGVVGNLAAESGLRTDSVERSEGDTQTTNIGFDEKQHEFTPEQIRDRSESDRIGPLKPGIGLAQWSDPERRKNLFTHKYQGHVAGAAILYNMDAQIDYLATELHSHRYNRVWKVLSTTNSLDVASDAFVRLFETPGAVINEDDPEAVQDVLNERRGKSSEALAAYNKNRDLWRRMFGRGVSWTSKEPPKAMATPDPWDILDDELNPAGQLQPKLTVNTPGDKYEQEADRVAEQVTQTPEPRIQRQCTCGKNSLEGECSECRKKKSESIAPLQRTASSPIGGITAPPIVDRVLRSSGSPLPSSPRSFMESGFGQDFSHVRVHTDQQARESAAAVQARAYTVGHNIVFGHGEHPSGDQRLLAHELTHVVQQTGPGSILQREVSDESKASNAKSLVRVIAVGSPSPAEMKAGHPFQFVHAAMSHGIDELTVVLVERTGYELAKIDLSVIEGMLAPAQVQWITPESSFASHLNQFGANSISSLHVFSHGLPGNVTLRYGWEGSANYGLSLPDVRKVKKNLFTQSARIEFDSCNSGTSDAVSPEGNLAQEFAMQSGRKVYGWTGRTSYSSVNEAQGGPAGHVEPSEIFRGWRPWHPTRFDEIEAASRAAGRVPELKAFSPATGPRSGGFESTFVIRMRLPKSRSFSVPAGGSAVVTCSNTRFVSEGQDLGALDPKASGAPVVQIVMQHEDGTQQGTRQFPVGDGIHSETWSNLQAGNYFLEIWRDGNTNMEVSSDIAVDIHK